MGSIDNDIPCDDTGDVLRRLIADGADLSQPREVVFFLAASTPAIAERLAKSVAGFSFSVRIRKNKTMSGWTCYCHKTMIASYQNIVAIEQTLEGVCSKQGGVYDGWETTA